MKYFIIALVLLHVASTEGFIGLGGLGGGGGGCGGGCAPPPCGGCAPPPCGGGGGGGGCGNFLIKILLIKNYFC